MFTQGMQAFMEVDSVSGGITGEEAPVWVRDLTETAVRNATRNRRWAEAVLEAGSRRTRCQIRR